MEEWEVCMRYDFRWIEVQGEEREGLTAALKLNGNTGWSPAFIERADGAWWVLLQRQVIR